MAEVARVIKIQIPMTGRTTARSGHLLAADIVGQGLNRLQYLATAVLSTYPHTKGFLHRHDNFNSIQRIKPQRRFRTDQEGIIGKSSGASGISQAVIIKLSVVVPVQT